MDKISYDDFAKVDLRVAKIKKVEEIPDATKLYKLTLDDGEGERNEGRRLRNSARTEWLARRARADPEILRDVVTMFSLQPLVYDHASYDAFSIRFRIPFAREMYSETRMV